MILTKEEIKTLIENEEIELEIDSDDIDLEKLKLKSYTNYLKKAELFYYCKELLQENLKNFEEEIKTKINNFLQNIKEYKEFKENMMSYLSGSYGKYFIEPRIKKYLFKYEEDIKDTIALFFNIFPEE